MTSLSWLHFSDLHCGMPEQGILWANIEKKLFEDLKKLREYCGPWDIIFMTGDLVHSGREFDKFTERFNRLYKFLKEELGSDPVLLPVPGNHDLYRPDEKLPEARVLKSWDEDEGVQNEFWQISENRYRELIEKSFSEYTKWYSNPSLSHTPSQMKQGCLPGEFSATIEKNGIKLGIVGLNTSFLQLSAGDYEGKLALHPSQLTAVCGEQVNDWVERHHLCFLLTHHPPQWLGEKARRYLNEEIAVPGRFAMHFFGHMHGTKYSKITVGGSESKRYWQENSLFGLKYFKRNGDEMERIHGYAAGRLVFNVNENTGELRFWPRKAELHDAGYWHIVEDSSITLNDDHGTKPEIIGLNPVAGSAARSISSLPVYDLMPAAFPLSGRARIIHTCRGSFETDSCGKNAPFKCPALHPDASNPNLTGSKNALCHVPVDEFETLGLSFVWHGSSILGDKEAWVKEAVVCSEVADRQLDVITKYLFRERESRVAPVDPVNDISELLMENLIVIGENKFSNHLFHLLNYKVPWRHTPVRSEILAVNPGNNSSPVFKVKMFFYDCFTNKIDAVHINDLRDSEFDWGIITFLANPFAPGKWILFLVGCSRPGQYLLLNWLRSPESASALSEIADHQKRHGASCDFIQVVVRGKGLVDYPRGTICRQWSPMEAIGDISGGQHLPFFTKSPAHAPDNSRPGDPIADLSLLVKMPDGQHWLEAVKLTLPDSLLGLFEKEQANHQIGLHITLYEFLHTKGYADQGFVNSLIYSTDEDFVSKLSKYFRELPPLNAVIRQTRLTSTSLQVLADVYISSDRLYDVQTRLCRSHDWHDYPGTRMLFYERGATAMDLVLAFCVNAGRKYMNRFNIKSIPKPMHLTLLRFPEETTERQRDDAKSWAGKFERKIWGKAESMRVVLAGAQLFPFGDHRAVDIT